MKGVIFAELIRFVEQEFSPEIADAMIINARIASEGAYTTVGNYPHQEALAMIGALAELTGEQASVLADTYGYWLSTRFVELYPEMFAGYSDVKTFLRDVDANHHREVKKLYPDAVPPSVIAEIDGEELTVSYASHRPFADVAFGLIRGYIAHFDADMVVVRDERAAGPHVARFVVSAIDHPACAAA